LRHRVGGVVRRAVRSNKAPDLSARAFSADNGRNGDGRMTNPQITETPYEVEGHEARLFQLGSGDSFQIELYDGYYSAAWSSSSPVHALLARLEPLLPEPVGTAVLISSADELVERPIADALDAMLNDSEDLDFFRLDYPDRTFTWQAGDGADQSPQFGFVGDMFDPQYATALLAATGTTAIAEASSHVLLVKVGPLLEPFHARIPLRG
jgi:hypothetical protein